MLPAASLQPLIQEIATKLYHCAGQTAAITPQDRENMWNRFHLFSMSDNFSELWMDLFRRTLCQRDSHCETIFIQNILKNWFTELLKERNKTDFPAVDDIDMPSEPISETEQCVLRYVAGFIAFKLKRFYSKFPGNKIAQHILGIIQEWKATQGGDTMDFLKYTTKWMDLVDRGGLFSVNDSVFCFFRQLESKSRPFINKSYVNAHYNINLKAVLQSALYNSAPIRTAWHGITRDFAEKDMLFKKVVDIFIDLRLRAFVKAVCYQNRERVSKKREKALRQDISGT